MNTLNDTASLHRDHLGKLLFDAFRGSPAQVALATLGAYNDARSGDPEAFRSRLMGLQLIFGGCLLARHSKISFSHKTRGHRYEPHGDHTWPHRKFHQLLTWLTFFRLGRSQDHDYAATFHNWGLFDG